ncbi:hypothetical protein [Eubacterium sp. LMAG:50]|uniref:hypothetical protein n=1 Tax=Eubacterium sp. LMAG:50 TaxID=1969563 RepID=UPI0025B8DFC5|nr:hypothetical protein [Eubacterium sp. LMAG:50]
MEITNLEVISKKYNIYLLEDKQTIVFLNDQTKQLKLSIKDKDDSDVFITLVKVLAEKDRDELFYNFLNVREMPPVVKAILKAMLFD